MYRFIPTIPEAHDAWTRLAVPRMRTEKSGCITLGPGKSRPTLQVAGRTVRASLVAYLVRKGTLPEWATLLRHTCDNPRCVNPEHLLPGTDIENARDRVERSPRQRIWRDGKCFKGHDLTLAGAVYTSPQGMRYCRPCSTARAQARRKAA